MIPPFTVLACCVTKLVPWRHHQGTDRIQITRIVHCALLPYKVLYRLQYIFSLSMQ